MRWAVLFISIIVSIIVAAAAVRLQAQQRDSLRMRVQQDLEDALEAFDTGDPELSGAMLTQLLQDLAANPVNINSAAAGELMQVPGIDLRLARAITAYRRQVKPFEHIEELQEVEGIGEVTYRKLRPYLTVGTGLALGKALYDDRRYWTHDGHFEMFSRYRRTLQQQAGYRRDGEEGEGYLGSPVQYYQRARYRSDHLTVNITQQKDAGERRSGMTGFDYNSWHLGLYEVGKLRSMVVGDYGLYFGQGLVLWNGRSFGKGRSVIRSAQRSSRGIRPYASSQESDFFRGAAATYGRKLQLTAFFSSRRLTAASFSGDTMRMPRENGYHRTARERAQRNGLRQRLYGGRVRVELPFGVVGGTGYRTIYDKPVTGGDRLYDRFDFRGHANSVWGIDYTILAGPATLFGEAARSRNGGTGILAGVQSALGPDTELAVIYRRYEADFQSMMGGSFGEYGGEPKNEEGFYMGLTHQLGDHITFYGYIDQFRAPTPRYGIDQPSRGYDWLALAEVALPHNIGIYLQARSEIEDAEYESEDAYGRTTVRLGKARRSTARLQFEYRVNPRIRLRSRLEGVWHGQPAAPAEFGYLLYQDVRVAPSDKLTIDGRITLFETDSYNTRLYQFENDLLYLMSSEMLYKQGQRLYLLVNYEPLSYLELWAKFGITLFENSNVIGSGLNQIQGNSRSDIGIQVRLKF